MKMTNNNNNNTIVDVIIDGNVEKVEIDAVQKTAFILKEKQVKEYPCRYNGVLQYFTREERMKIIKTPSCPDWDIAPDHQPRMRKLIERVTKPGIILVREWDGTINSVKVEGAGDTRLITYDGGLTQTVSINYLRSLREALYK